ncbi:integrase, partial [Salmonella enterica]|nr:integrase [Salmonella enterica]
MGRKRAPGNEWMPKGVFFRPSGYYWKPGGSTENIAPADATKAEVWVAYEKKVEGRKNRITFTQLWRKFLASADYADLAPRTQKDYLAHEKYILAVFGDAEAKAIKPEHIRRYMDARGQKSRVQANHEHSSMSRVFRWSYQRGYVPGNPCVGVDKFPKPQRDRYITDEEYRAIYNNATPAVRAAMEIAYLCAARVSDVLKMNWNQILEKGIFIQQGKTGVK